MGLDVEDFYRRFGPLVLRRCRALLKDESQAVDAMHDVFVAILRHDERLTAEAPAGLLLTTATNLCLNRLRQRRRRPEELTDDSETLVLNEIAHAGSEGSAENRSLARRILDRVFDDGLQSTRLIAVLHHVDGRSYEEVAAEVGMSVSGVRKRLRNLQLRQEEVLP